MPVYLFFGEEEYLFDKEMKNLKKTVLNDEINELNYQKYDNPDAKILQEILLSNPMLFGSTMHVIKFNKTLIGNQKGGIKENDIDDVIKKLEYVNDNVHVVFTCIVEHNSEKKPDKRKKIFKALSKLGTVKEFPPQFKNYEHWVYTPIIQKIAKEKDIILTNETIANLVETVGIYLSDIDSQLEKLKLLAYPNKKITTDMIKEISIVHEDIFKTIDLILENKIDETLEKLKNIFDGNHYLQVLALFQTSFLKLLQTKVYSKQYSSYEISKLLGQNEKIIQMNLQKMQSVSLKKLIEIKQNLSIGEYKLKTGEYQDPMLAFERILLGGKL